MTERHHDPPVRVDIDSRRAFDVWNEVPLVPQTTGMSCWAAAAAMIVGWRDRVAVDPRDVAEGVGRWEAYREGLDPNDVHALARTWGLVIQPQERLTIEALRETLEEYGPLWVGEASPGLHSIVVTGVRGDGTPGGTFVRINDPWPVGRGERYVLTFRAFRSNIEAAAAAVGQHPQVLHSGGRRKGAHGVHHQTHRTVRVRSESSSASYGTPVELFELYRNTPPADHDRPGTPDAGPMHGRSGTVPDHSARSGAAHVLQTGQAGPAQGANTMAIIAIDPGHGGSTRVDGSSPNNATGPAGTLEKDLTLDVGLSLREILQQRGHTVVMTRDTDVNLGLAARAHVARDNSADVFVSIHFNGWEDPDTQGTVTFVHEDASSASHALATQVQGAVRSVTGYSDRGVKRARFGVLNPRRHRETTAACLVEVSFLTNAAEEERLSRNEPVGGTPYRRAIANAIADGIDAHLTASVPAEGQRRIGGSAAYGSVIDQARNFGPEIEDAVRRLLDEGVAEDEVRASSTSSPRRPRSRRPGACPSAARSSCRGCSCCRISVGSAGRSPRLRLRRPVEVGVADRGAGSRPRRNARAAPRGRPARGTARTAAAAVGPRSARLASAPRSGPTQRRGPAGPGKSGSCNSPIVNATSADVRRTPSCARRPHPEGGRCRSARRA